MVHCILRLYSQMVDFICLSKTQLKNKVIFDPKKIRFYCHDRPLPEREFLIEENKRTLKRGHFCLECWWVRRWLMQQGSEGYLYRVVIDKLMICCDVQGQSRETWLWGSATSNICICLTSLSCAAIMGWWLLPLAWWNGQISDFSETHSSKGLQFDWPLRLQLAMVTI